MKKRAGHEPLLYGLKRLRKDKLGILCLDCGWIGLSYHRHDYKSCPCPNQATVDGGDDYCRYGAISMKKVQLVLVCPTKRDK